MKLRRLQPDTDRDLLEEAYGWARDTPRWFREMDAVYGRDDFEAYLRSARKGGNIECGVFDPDFTAVIVLSEQKPARFEAHIMAKRTSNFQTLAWAGTVLRYQIFEAGAQEIVAWVASKNRPVIRLVQAMGLSLDGQEMLHGSYHNRVIRWLRLSQNRSEWESELRMAA